MNRPNILLLLADQMRGDCLGVVGHPLIKTPAIDALAAEGKLMSSAFSTQPICVPARAQLLSGRWGHETGNRWGNASWKYRRSKPPLTMEDDGVMMDAHIQTLPENLTENGYHTAAIGKCHFAPRGASFGFMHRENAQCRGRYLEQDDAYYRYLADRGLASQHHEAFGMIDGGWRADNCRPGEDWMFGISPHVSAVPAEHQNTRWCGDRALAYLENCVQDRPFFLQVGFHAPHDPFSIPPEYADLYNPEDIQLPPYPTQPLETLPSRALKSQTYGRMTLENAMDDATRQKNWAFYLANITFIDEQVGRLVQALKDDGRYDNTLIIFTSDHGEQMGQHCAFGKGVFYDPSIHIPLVFGGGAVAQQGVSDDLCHLMDLFPTILKSAQIEQPSDLRDARALDIGLYDVANSAPDVIFAELGEGATTQYMVRSATHKLIVHPHHNAREFFSLCDDPLEYANLADTGHPVEAHLQVELDRWLERERPFFRDCFALKETRY